MFEILALERPAGNGYQTDGRLSEVIDLLGQPWRYGYQGKHLRTKTDPLGRSTTYEYDATGLLGARIDPLGKRRTERYEYDKTRREYYQRQTSPGGVLTERPPPRRLRGHIALRHPHQPTPRTDQRERHHHPLCL